MFERLKRHNYYYRIIILKKFVRIMGVKPIHILLPIVLSFVVASLDGLSLALLAPLAKGIVTNSFRFVGELPVIKHIFALFFPKFAETQTAILYPNRTMFLVIVGIIFVVMTLKNVIYYANSAISAYWHGKFQNRIYIFVFNRFLEFGKLFFDRTNQGYLLLVLNYSDMVLRLLQLFERSVNNIFTLVAYFVIMLIISWKMTLVTIFLVPILHYALTYVIKKIGEMAEIKNKVKVEQGRNVFNILSCIPLVKAYSKEDKTKEMYAKSSEELRVAEFRTERMKSLIEPIQDFLITTAMLLMISIVALILARDKPAEISVFVVFFVAAKRALPLFTVFNDIKVTFVQARPPLAEVSKILDDIDKFFVPDGPEIFGGLKNGIMFNHMNFSYIKDIPVIKDMSFMIEKGKTTAIVGPTGAGKTTLISLIMRFYDCPPSSILIDGVDIRNFTKKSLKDHVALVTQEAMLLNDSLKNNIIFGLDREIPEEELIEVTKRARLYDFIMQLPGGFNTEIGDRGVKLSGGEKQLVAIARCLLKGSEILILDEATSSLDSKTERLIQEALDEAIHGKTAIVIAHRLSTIRSADKIVVIEDGGLIEAGGLTELLGRKGKFYEYWEAQKFY